MQRTSCPQSKCCPWSIQRGLFLHLILPESTFTLLSFLLFRIPLLLVFRPSFFPFISPPSQSLQLHLLLQHLSHLVSFLFSHSLPLAVSSFLLLRNAPFYLFRAPRLLCMSVCPQGSCLFRKVPFLDNRLPIPQTSLCSPNSTSLRPSESTFSGTLCRRFPSTCQ